MARDYKHTPKHSAKGGQRNSMLPFVSGLAVGLLVAVIIYFWAGLSRQVVTPVAEPDSKSAISAPDETRPVPGEDTAKPKPRFDFYTILPEMEVKVPEWKLNTSEDDAEQVMQPGAYVFQVGSFQRFQEADRAKAQLALQGLSANIQRVLINGQDVWYRVRIGPFTDAEELKGVRARLIENEMDFMLLRIRSEEVST